MGAAALLFWIFAAVSVVGGLMAVFVPRIVHAVFSLMLAFAGVAGIYGIAGADFLAITQIIVYVGGVLVLMAFGILLTGRTAQALGDQEVRNRKTGIVLALLVFGGLIAAISRSRFASGSREAADGTTDGIGALLLGDYIIAFEFASILLLVALMGAAFLVRGRGS